MTRPRRSEQGSTLVEVLVSVVMLGIAVAGLLGGMTTAVAGSNISRDQAQAETILTSTGEAVKDPTLNGYCPGDTSYHRPPGVPSNWTVTFFTQQWEPQIPGFVPSVAGCNGQMLKITIRVDSPDQQVKWSRDVVRGGPR